MESKNDVNETLDDSQLNEVLKDLLKKHGHYYGLDESKSGKKYRDPTTRYEAWIMANAISNVLLLKEIKLLRRDLMGKKKLKENIKSDRRRRRK